MEKGFLNNTSASKSLKFGGNGLDEGGDLNKVVAPSLADQTTVDSEVIMCSVASRLRI